MYKDNVNGISIASVLDDHNKSKEGVYPVKIRITVNRASSYYQTGKRLSKENWDKLPDSRVPELAKVRQSIKASFDLIVKRVDELSGAGNFSIQSLNIRLGRESGGTVDSYYKVKIDSLLKEKRTGTAISDSNALKAFQKYAGKNIKLETVTVEWLKKMGRSMLDDNISMATVAFISESLGHSDLKTTEHYLVSFEPEERKNNAMLLTMFPEEEKTKK